MRADDNVHHPFFQVFHGLFLLGSGPEPAEQVDPDREVLKPLHKGIVVLLRQDRSGHKVYHLLALLDRLKGGPDRNLCLAVAHVPADEPVHDLRALHVMFRIFDGLHLVFCLLKGEHLLEFLLPDRIRPVDKAFRALARRVQLHQIFRDALHGLLHLALCLSPLDSPQLVEPGLFRIRPGILLDQVHLRHRDVENAPLCIGDLHIILYDLIHLDLLDPLVDADPVVFMDHIIAGLELREILDLLSLILPAALFLFFPSEDVRLRDDHKFQHGILVPLRRIAAGNHDLPRLYGPLHIIAVKAAQVIIP